MAPHGRFPPMPTLPLLPHDLLWSSFPHAQTLWVIRRQTPIAREVQWHTLIPRIAAARTDRAEWIILHVDRTALPTWETMTQSFPTIREWSTPDFWNFLLVQWTAAANDQPVPLWPDSPLPATSSRNA